MAIGALGDGTHWLYCADRNQPLFNLFEVGKKRTKPKVLASLPCGLFITGPLPRFRLLYGVT